MTNISSQTLRDSGFGPLGAATASLYLTLQSGPAWACHANFSRQGPCDPKPMGSALHPQIHTGASVLQNAVSVGSLSLVRACSRETSAQIDEGHVA